EENAVVNTLTTGEADGAYLDTASAAVPLLRDDTVQVFQGPSTNVWSLITTERGGLADPRLRRALSLALERDGIARAAFGGMAEPWSAPLGPGGWGYETDRFQQAYDGLRGAPADPGEADLAEARDLVREAGAPDEPIVVASDGEPARTVIANAVVDAAGKIGLQARIATVPRQQFGSYYVDADLREEVDLFSDEYWISKNDPVGFYKNGASDAGVNFSGFADDGYDRLVKQAQSATDDAERAELAVELQDRWTEAMPWIPVVQTPTTLAMRSESTGAPASAAFMSYPCAADLRAGEEPGRRPDDGYDRLVKQAQSATDDAERAELAVELQDRWTEAMPWIPVVQTPTTLAMRSEITGAPASAAFMSYPWAADLGAGEESGR